MSVALHRAHNFLEACTCHVNVALVFSASSPTDEDARTSLNVIREMVAAGLQVVFVGLGERLNAGVLHALSSHAGGEFHYVQQISQLGQMMDLLRLKLEHVVIRDATLGIMFHENDGSHQPLPIQKVFAGSHVLREAQRGRMVG